MPVIAPVRAGQAAEPDPIWVADADQHEVGQVCHATLEDVGGETREMVNVLGMAVPRGVVEVGL
jgi:hypothetical protein